MRGFRKFCQRGSTFDNGFLIVEGREDQNTTIRGQSSARQQNADDDPTYNADLVAL